MDAPPPHTIYHTYTLAISGRNVQVAFSGLGHDGRENNYSVFHYPSAKGTNVQVPYTKYMNYQINTGKAVTRGEVNHRVITMMEDRENPFHDFLFHILWTNNTAAENDTTDKAPAASFDGHLLGKTHAPTLHVTDNDLVSHSHGVAVAVYKNQLREFCSVVRCKMNVKKSAVMYKLRMAVTGSLGLTQAVADASTPISLLKQIKSVLSCGTTTSKTAVMANMIINKPAEGESVQTYVARMSAAGKTLKGITETKMTQLLTAQELLTQKKLSGAVHKFYHSGDFSALISKAKTVKLAASAKKSKKVQKPRSFRSGLP